MARIVPYIQSLARSHSAACVRKITSLWWIEGESAGLWVGYRLASQIWLLSTASEVA